MDQGRMPLMERLIEYKRNNSISYHVPGHKNGLVFQEDVRTLFQDVLSIDVTEIEGMDDLHHPEGVIHEAENLASALYNVEDTAFLVGGSTAGNLAMLMGTLSEGDQVIVQRNSHQSVFHGLVLSGAKPIFIEPVIDENTGMTLGIDGEAVKTAIRRYPQAKAVIITSPSYEGYVQPLHSVVDEAHRAGMVVLVDEAHGAHLITEGTEWPGSALKAGADAVVQSAHKMLPAMTMTAYLHIQGSRVNKQAIRRYLRMFQSSSPSYPLMGSLDGARAYLAGFTPESYNRLYEKVIAFRKELGIIPQWELAPLQLSGFKQDPLKIVLRSRSNATGLELQRALNKHGIYPELANDRYLVLTLPLSLSWNDSKEHVERMRRAVEAFSVEKAGSELIAFKEPVRERITELPFTYKELETMETEFVNWEQGAGHLAGEDIVPYPPGIPLIMRGERIEQAQIERLKELVRSGAKFQTGTHWLKEGMKRYR
ncbi:aminotransferase class I/II-fold pyridoxal phosphate-dependent enzyme [Alteribacter aurantiacus]|uniref:aminotransferase class I/II-fold pyridoxal phosphate-dependent enzyme n=1 Tax=Alteribacter aurantiacus TaxID=254410 RepID=UPI0004155FC0|nr:aminotransferase class I/II-fold pyridoxal phosphate-dependent enzyme [Alteribacter aurantiacus]